jgi:hypothetical protein
MELWTEAQGSRDEWLNGSRAQFQARTTSCLADPLILRYAADRGIRPEKRSRSEARYLLLASQYGLERRHVQNTDIQHAAAI